MRREVPVFIRLLDVCVAAAVLTAVLSAVSVVFFPSRFSGHAKCIVLVLAALLLICALFMLVAEYTLYPSSRISFLRKPIKLLVSRLTSDTEAMYSKQELASEMLNTQAQIMSLQNQINPHFLYNTLESIRSKALMHDEEEIATMIEALALIFRYNIDRDSPTVLFSDELENVNNYLTIQNYRFRNKFLLRLELDEVKPLLENYVLPPLTLQPLVENAVHHGLEGKIGTGTICISGYCTQSKLFIRISDDGVGMPAKTLDVIRDRLRNTSGPLQTQDGSGGAGIALANVHRRLQLFFGNQYGLDIMSAPNAGTQIELTLPLVPPIGNSSHEN